MGTGLNFITQLILVAIGGMFGTLVRFFISYAWAARVAASGALFKFPWPTFLANLVGSFVLGAVMAYVRSEGISPVRASMVVIFMGMGFCGGLTTFSSFIYELFTLAKSLNTVMLTVYFSLSLAGGLAMFVLAYRLAVYVWK